MPLRVRLRGPLAVEGSFAGLQSMQTLDRTIIKLRLGLVHPVLLRLQPSISRTLKAETDHCGTQSPFTGSSVPL